MPPSLPRAVLRSLSTLRAKAAALASPQLSPDLLPNRIPARRPVLTSTLTIGMPPSSLCSSFPLSRPELLKNSHRSVPWQQISPTKFMYLHVYGVVGCLGAERRHLSAPSDLLGSVPLIFFYEIKVPLIYLPQMFRPVAYPCRFMALHIRSQQIPSWVEI